MKGPARTRKDTQGAGELQHTTPGEGSIGLTDQESEKGTDQELRRRVATHPRVPQRRLHWADKEQDAI